MCEIWCYFLLPQWCVWVYNKSNNNNNYYSYRILAYIIVIITSHVYRWDLCAREHKITYTTDEPMAKHFSKPKINICCVLIWCKLGLMVAFILMYQCAYGKTKSIVIQLYIYIDMMGKYYMVCGTLVSCEKSLSWHLHTHTQTQTHGHWFIVNIRKLIVWVSTHVLWVSHNDHIKSDHRQLCVLENCFVCGFLGKYMACKTASRTHRILMASDKHNYFDYDIIMIVVSCY